MFTYFEINFHISETVLNNCEKSHYTEAGALDWKIVASKIAAITIVPFLLLSAFEAVAINGIRLIGNGVIFATNSLQTIWKERHP